MTDSGLHLSMQLKPLTAKGGNPKTYYGYAGLNKEGGYPKPYGFIGSADDNGL